MKNEYKSLEDLPLFLSAEQVAAVLNISKATAYQLFHSRGFPLLTVGERRLVCPRDAFVQWIRSNITDENELFSAKE